MAQRKTVQIHLEIILNMAKTAGWSAATLARKVGKHERWFSEIKRDKNLPSPEEAAKMCLLLNTTPEEIMLTQGGTDGETAKLQADVQTVKDLIEQQRAAQGIKKDLPREVDGEISEIIKKMPQTVSNFFLTGAPDELDEVEQFIEWLVSKREKREGGV